MPVLKAVLSKIDSIVHLPKAEAHCDIPCGIYDPHLAQVAAHTVIRMNMLIGQLKVPTNDAKPEERLDFQHKLTRYTDVKEKHAELCKHEVRIIWGDYFKLEHLQKFPELHDLTWKIMKAGSKGKQDINMTEAEELLNDVNRFAEIFWNTKGVNTVRVKAPYPTEREIVLPKL